MEACRWEGAHTCDCDRGSREARAAYLDEGERAEVGRSEERVATLRRDPSAAREAAREQAGCGTTRR